MNKQSIMRISIVILIVITIIFLILLCTQLILSQNNDSVFQFNNWYITGLLAVFFITQLICIFKEKFSIKKAGFYLLHIGLLAFLLGNFMYFVKGRQFYTQLFVDKTTTRNIAAYEIVEDEISGEKKFQASGNVDIGFAIGVNKFTVTKYEENPGMDKWYEVEMIGSEEVVGKNNQIKLLTVNNPLYSGKYKIYLIDYDKNFQEYIILLFKYDPGEYISTTGIVMIITGSFLMCFKDIFQGTLKKHSKTQNNKKQNSKNAVKSKK